MQSLGAVTTAQLKSMVQVPCAKLEIYYGSAWVDLTNLSSTNYLKSFSISLGGATMTPNPVAGTWTATLDNPDNCFFPANTGGSYYDYLTTGRLVRISIGGTYGGSDVYWQRILGVMDSPRFTINPNEVQLSGMDYFQYLDNFELRSPSNYWGTSVTKSTSDPTEALGAEIYDEADACEIGAHEADNVTNWAGASGATPSSIADVGGGSTYALKIALAGSSGSTSETFTTAGLAQWQCPAGVTSVAIECWGAGGGGGGSSVATVGAGGGGGGAYAKKNALTVVPGNSYSYSVGTKGGGGSSDGGDGSDTYFNDLLTCLAKGGGGGNAPSGGIGGAGGYPGIGTDCVGDTRFYGGGGGDGAGGGGGGGSSGGTVSNGNTGAAAVGDTGGGGGAAPTGGSVGGDGANADATGSAPASGTGGGGGGGGKNTTGATSGGDGKDGKIILTYASGGTFTATCDNTNIGSIVGGTEYKLTFKYQVTTGTASVTAGIYVGSNRQGEISGLTSSSWTVATAYFTAGESGTAQLHFDITVTGTSAEVRIDVISLKSVTAISVPRYSMPAACTGIYYATWNGNPIWYGVDPDGWTYDADHNEFVFSENTNVVAGTDNLIIYYHTAQVPLYVVADILVSAGLYATRALAIAAMHYTEVGDSIDRVWFKAGTTALAAIKMICERCNFRFWFDYNSVPHLMPAPTVDGYGDEDFAFEQPHLSNVTYFEDAAELYNRINIEGEQQAQPVGTEQTMPTNYKGTATDATSVAAYGERVMTISNYLFQSDAECAAMATELLAEYKDPKKYISFDSPFNPVPLDVGDTVRWQLSMTAAPGYGGEYNEFLYGDGTLYGSTGTWIIGHGIVRDIKINDYNTTYVCEVKA